MKKLVAIGALAFTLSSIVAPLSVDAANYRTYSYSNNGSCNSIQSQLKNYTSNGNSCTPGKVVIPNGSCPTLEDYGIKSNNSNSNCNNNGANYYNSNSNCNSANSDCYTKNSSCNNSNSDTKGAETKNSTNKDCNTWYVVKPSYDTNSKQNCTPSTENTTPSTEKTTPNTENTTPCTENTTPGTNNQCSQKPTTPSTETNTPSTENTTPSKPTTPSSESKDTKDLSYAEQVVELVNQERAKEGLSALTIDKTLTSAALVRAKEIQGTFEHTRPNGSSFSTAITEAGGSFRGAGENIAYGQKTPQAVVTAWMNSPGHRANIMNKNYTKIGVGYLTNSANTPYWVQLFSY